jgi:DNA-binding CsgD family transcriptional regulator
MGLEVFEGVIEKIYEASVVPEQWPDVLKSLAQVSDCKDGMLVANPQNVHARWVASDGLVPLMNVFTRDGWGGRNTKAARLAPMRYPGFIRDSDIFSPEEMENDALYRGLTEPHGFWYSIGSMIYVPTGDLLVFDIERAFGEPPVEPEAVERLDALRPHLARAALISARLGLERARAMVQALNAIGLPAAAFGKNGVVLAANSLLEVLDTQFVARAHGRLALADPTANASLQETLDRAAIGAWSGGVMSFPVPAVAEKPALIAHLVPVTRSAHDLFVGAVALLVATPLSAPRAPSEDLLNGLFDLTPAEARVARAIVEGNTIESFSSTLGVSRETVRAQLKSVFAKTGVQRQAELVALLVGKTLPLAGPI